MVNSKNVKFRIPDLHRFITFPYPGPHPEATRAERESIDWLSSYEPFGPVGATRKFYEKARVGILGGYGYPYASYEGMRACTDFINVIITLDEMTDHMSGKDTREIMVNHLRVLFGGECDGSPISKISADIRKRIYDTFNPISLERMLAFHRDTIMGMVAEAENREVKKILNLEDYTEFRILQGAMPSMFDLMECCFNFILPDEVHNDPVFKLMHREAIIIVLWTNDICSYNNEQSREGHAFCNAVSVVMNDEGLDVHKGMDRMDEIMVEHFRIYNDCKTRLRSFGPEVDAMVKDYIHGLDCWTAGEIVYCHFIPKYFQVGPDTIEGVKKTHMVTLLTESETDMCFVKE